MQRKSVPVVAMVFVLMLCSCGQKNEAPKPESIFQPTATIQELMQSVVDPNVDAIWNSVATIVSAAGVEERHPETDADWLTLRHHAIALREVSNLLVIEGRKAAAENATTSSHSSELGPQEIEKLIAAQRPAFIKNAHDLHDAATIALMAIEAKDVEKLEAAGGVIEHACEQCHSQFWYPGDKRPTQ